MNFVLPQGLRRNLGHNYLGNNHLGHNYLVSAGIAPSEMQAAL